MDRAIHRAYELSRDAVEELTHYLLRLIRCYRISSDGDYDIAYPTNWTRKLDVTEQREEN